jgi:hypothetical protein
VPINTEAVKTVVQTYYARGVAAADRARDRAEKGYTIASAIAAALVAAGVFAHLDERPASVKILGLTGFALWLLAAMLFILAVSVPVKTHPEEDWIGDDAFVEGVSKQIDGELRTLKRRQFAALTATLLAVLFTVAAFSVATALPQGSDPEPARLALTSKADTGLARLCSVPVSDLLGTVDPDNLDDDIVEVDVPPGACNDAETTIRLPGTAIIGEEKLTRFPVFRG